MRVHIWILTLVNLICYLDRYIIASVAPKVQEEFGLSHAQTGSFMSIFMVGYMLTSPLFGFYGDRRNRPPLMAFGVLVWSFATWLSGATHAFWLLLIARALVGVGEASFATLAPPYIRDNLTGEAKINRALGTFYLAIPVGAALGYMWGGWMADHFSWRWAFYLGALPGILLTLNIWKLPENRKKTPGGSELPWRESLIALRKNKDYVLGVAAYTAQTFAMGGFSAWAPQYGRDVLGVTLVESSFKIGASTLLSGILGTFIGAKWGGRFMAEGQEQSGVASCRAFARFCGWTSVIATPFGAWAFLASGFNEFVMALFLAQIALFSALAPANTIILSSVPSGMAATAFAVSIFSIHALGDVISPPITGLLADFIPMRDAMWPLVLAVAVSGWIWFVGSRLQGKEQP